MNETNLTERYIYAVTKKLPHRIREDVSKELTTLIDDMLESRCGSVKPTDKDVRVVLTELGTPSELASQYLTDKTNYLIGPEYYQSYKTILLIVIAATSFGMCLSAFMTLLFESKVNLSLFYLFEWFGNIFMSLIMAFGFVTLFFAYFERKGIKFDMDDTDLNDLPTIPIRQETIPKSSVIFGIASSIIFCILFLLIPGIFSFLYESEIIPIFNPVSIRKMWYLFILFTLLSLSKEFYKLYIGRYTRNLAVFLTIANLLSLIPAYLFTHSYNLMNQELLQIISSIFSKEEDRSFLLLLINNIPNLFFMGIVFAILLESITFCIKAFQYDRS